MYKYQLICMYMYILSCTKFFHWYGHMAKHGDNIPQLMDKWPSMHITTPSGTSLYRVTLQVLSSPVIDMNPPPHQPGHIGVDGTGSTLEQYLQPLLKVFGGRTVLDAQVEQLSVLEVGRGV